MVIRSRKESKYIPPSDGHKYINKYGEYVPSVTMVLKMIPKDALITWANSLGWKRKSVSAELNKAAKIGTIVHSVVEDIIQKDKSTPGGIDLDKLKKEINDKYYAECRNSIAECRNSIMSFIQWYEINKDYIELIELEKYMIGDLFAGTCDMICKYKDKLMIFDFKTSSNFYFSMFIQMAAYSRLYMDETGEDIEDNAILRFDKKNGEIAKLKKLSDIKNSDIDYYYYVFEQCLNLYRSIYLLEKDWKS